MEKKKRSSKKNEQSIAQEVLEEFLKTVGIEAQASSTLTDDMLDVELETQDSGIVIGYHGEVLEALQLLLSFAVSKKLERFVRVSLEVGEYKRKRMDWLTHLAEATKERVLLEGNEIPLTNLKSWERRVIHMFFQDDKEVVSESVGEGKDRTLIIKQRT